MRALLVLVWAGALACTRAAPTQAATDASADPAIGHLTPIGLASATSRTDAAAPTIESSTAPPTPDEAAETPIPRFVPVVKDPSTRSKLPCPPATKLSVLDTSVECRLLHPKNLFRASEGPSLSFHPNGKLASQGQHVEGEQTGHWWFFRDDGSLDYEVDYVAGEYDGLYVSYFPGGRRRLEHHEKRGKLDGVARTWDERGKLTAWSLYEDGHLVRAKYFH